jgi:hypothetical protein
MLEWQEVLLKWQLEVLTTTGIIADLGWAAMRAAFEELTGLGDLTFPAAAVLGIGSVHA